MRIGVANHVSIPWRMLQLCFEPIADGRGYDGRFFRTHFQLQASDHSCHVHLIGQIFVRAGIAEVDSNRYVAAPLPA